MSPLHSLGQDNQNQMIHGFFDLITQLPLALASYDVNVVGVT